MKSVLEIVDASIMRLVITSVVVVVEGDTVILGETVVTTSSG
jgi:hypothetical protein